MSLTAEDSAQESFVVERVGESRYDMYGTRQLAAIVPAMADFGGHECRTADLAALTESTLLSASRAYVHERSHGRLLRAHALYLNWYKKSTPLYDFLHCSDDISRFHAILRE